MPLSDDARGWYLRQLAKSQQEWSEQTFGSANVRGPSGPLKHLIKECQETIDNPDDDEEYADILILLLDTLWRSGRSIDTIILAALNKMEANKQRKWPPLDQQDMDKPVEHIRSNDE